MPWTAEPCKQTLAMDSNGPTPVTSSYAQGHCGNFRSEPREKNLNLKNFQLLRFVSSASKTKIDCCCASLRKSFCWSLKVLAQLP